MDQQGSDVRLHLHDEHAQTRNAADSTDDPESASGGSQRDSQDDPRDGESVRTVMSEQLDHLGEDPALDPSLPLNKQVPVSVENCRFPYAIVFGSLPCLSWLFPFVGHLGLCDSTGRVHDFAGPFFVQIDSFMVSPLRFAQMQPEQMELQPGPHMYNPFDDGRRPQQWLQPAQRRWIWDHALSEGDAAFARRSHNILCMNCHHHVSFCFARMGLRISAWCALWIVMTRGQFVSVGAAVAFWLPAVMTWTLVGLIVWFAS